MLPLDGIRVLDLSRVVAGPYCTRMLASLGAEIIKLEPPAGDMTRGRPEPGKGSAPGFVQLNTGKRLISIDFGSDEGTDLVRRLAGRVDVLIENFRPGVMEAWGLDQASLTAENPRLVYVSISGYGQTGEWRHRRAYAPFVHAEAGHLATNAQLRKAPIEHIPESTADLAAAKDATIAILAALHQRERTGRGQAIDVSLAHAILFMNEFAGAALTEGAPPPKSGSTPQTIFTSSDGHAFSAGNPVSSQVFSKLCRAFGCLELVDDERFVDSGSRRGRRAEVIAELQSALNDAGPFDEVLPLIEAEGLVVGRVRQMSELADLEWVRERDALVTLADENGSPVVVPSPPWILSDAESGGGEPIGPIGRDNDRVLQDLLDLGDEDVAALHKRGVLKRSPGPGEAAQ